MTLPNFPHRGDFSGTFRTSGNTTLAADRQGWPAPFRNRHLSRAYDERDGVATGYIQSLAQDRDGRVWIGSNANGLTVYEGGRFKRLGPDESPPAKNIALLSVDSRGDLWIGTAANGLFRRRHGRYEHFTKEHGLGDVLIALMLEDRGGNLWVSTTRGISRLERARVDAVAEGRATSLDPIILDRTDGLVTLEGSGGGFDPSGLRAEDGRLWFSTIDGIVVIDPSSFAINRFPPPVLIEGATLAGHPARPAADGTIQVPAGTSSIEVPYTAFSLLVPAKVRFRYRLVGSDDVWEDAETRRVAYFSRLPPGTYTFEVMAANNDGVWNPTPVWAVNARNDTVESFANYTAQFAEEHLRAAGLRCRLRIQPDLSARELSAETRRQLYLAFKEAVTNAVKHAHASEVRITLAIDGHALVVEVTDDGCGLLPEQADPTENGLRNMRDRMDINLPGMSGIECTRHLHALAPGMQIVMLTAFDDSELVFESLKAGASGYILKRAPGADIVEAIRDVHAGGAPMSGTIARKVVRFFSQRQPRPAAPEVETLSDRERAVLDALSEGQFYKEIAESLGISINTVRKHIKGIYEKLHVHSRLEAVTKLGRF